MSPPEDLDRLSHAELKGLVIRQWEQIVELQRMVAALRDEIARLKGGPGRPNLKPSGMERGTEPKPPGSSGDRKRPRGSTRSKLSIDEERTVRGGAAPRRPRFKGYTSRDAPGLTRGFARSGTTSLINRRRFSNKSLCSCMAPP